VLDQPQVLLDEHDVLLDQRQVLLIEHDVVLDQRQVLVDDRDLLLHEPQERANSSKRQQSVWGREFRPQRTFAFAFATASATITSCSPLSAQRRCWCVESWCSGSKYKKSCPGFTLGAVYTLMPVSLS